MGMDKEKKYKVARSIAKTAIVIIAVVLLFIFGESKFWRESLAITHITNYL